MKTSIQIETTTAGGKKSRKAISDVNPNATNEQVKGFAQQLVALTTDTYGSTSRVNVDSLKPASSLADLPLSWYGMSDTDEGTFSGDNVFATTRAYLTTVTDDYNGLGITVADDYEGQTLVLLSKPAGTLVGCGFYGGHDINFLLGFAFPAGASIGDFVFQVPETEKYAAKTFIVRVTE